MDSDLYRNATIRSRVVYPNGCETTPQHEIAMQEFILQSAPYANAKRILIFAMHVYATAKTRQEKEKAVDIMSGWWNYGKEPRKALHQLLSKKIPWSKGTDESVIFKVSTEDCEVCVP